MTDARERLERAIRRELRVGTNETTWEFTVTQERDGDAYLGDEAFIRRLADAVERALAPEPPAPLKVWPGLEGDGLKLARKAFDTAYDDGARRGLPADDLSRAARTAQTAYLWRALVASLPTAPTDVARECVTVGLRPVTRAALAALADPYDGGGKGVGK